MGKYCDETKLADGKTCLTGHDCNQLGTVYPRKCKYGEYASANNGECVECDENQFCGANALTAGTDCPNGYYCYRNTTTQFPNWKRHELPASDADKFYLCELGQYCDNGQSNGETQTVNDCLEGTYMPRYGAETRDSCVPCPSGFKCPAAKTITPEECDVGYYCPKNTGSSTHTDPPQICTAGHYCPKVTRDALDAVGSDVTVYPNVQSSGE